MLQRLLEPKWQRGGPITLASDIPDTNTYVLTPDGQRFAIFYTKIGNRVLRPLMALSLIHI